jgi:hypothetical protein
MEFTIKMNGKVVVISPDILEQLSPILTELAKTPEGKEKLSKGFELVIDLDKVGSIQIYQNGSEILTDTCKTFFTTHPDLLKHIDNLLTAIKIAKFLNQPGSGKKTQPSKTTLSVAAAPADPYIVKVPPNGDCLLEAALYHITKKAEHEALTAQQIRREMIDKINNKRSLSDRDKRLILQDILDARIFAVEKNIQTQEPHSYLFSENAEGLDFLCADENITLNRTTEQWNTLLDAYAKYISHNLDGTATRPSLGGYAEAYLNQKYFQGKSLLVVTKESQGNTFTGNQQHTINDSTFPQKYSRYPI